MFYSGRIFKDMTMDILIIKPCTYYFLPSLNFPTLSFKREGAKEASFLKSKIFTRRHISKWVRNSMYCTWLDDFGKLERLNFSMQMSSMKKNVGLEISHHLYLFSVKMYDWLKEKFGSMVRKLINTTHYSRCFHCQMKLKPVILSSKHFVLFSKKRDGFFNTKLNDRRCLKL